MEVQTKNLKKIVKFMKKEGVLSLKTQELDIQLSSSALFENKKYDKSDQSQKEDLGKKPTEEELLFWSTPGMNPGEVINA